MEAKKIAEWNAKQAKIEEASRKKEELDKEFAAQTKEALEAKMEQYEEKREALISDMKEKLKVCIQRYKSENYNLKFNINKIQVHAQEIEKTRQSLENKKDEERRAIEEKLKAAESMRDENIKKMLDRLKEHVSTKFFIFFSSNFQSQVLATILFSTYFLLHIYISITNHHHYAQFWFFFCFAIHIKKKYQIITEHHKNIERPFECGYTC